MAPRILDSVEQHEQMSMSENPRLGWSHALSSGHTLILLRCAVRGRGASVSSATLLPQPCPRHAIMYALLMIWR